jgi:hypothetical protein
VREAGREKEHKKQKGKKDETQIGRKWEER